MEVDEVLWVVSLGGTAGCVAEVSAVCREYVPVWVDGSSRDVTVILEDWVEGVVWRYTCFPHSLSLYFS